MSKRALIVLLCLSLFSVAVSAKDKEYQQGILRNLKVSWNHWYFTVELGDMVYTAHYFEKYRWSYAPGADFTVGEKIEIRLEKKHMYIKRPNEKEIKTEIIKKERLKSQG